MEGPRVGSKVKCESSRLFPRIQIQYQKPRSRAKDTKKRKRKDCQRVDRVQCSRVKFQRSNARIRSHAPEPETQKRVQGNRPRTKKEYCLKKNNGQQAGQARLRAIVRGARRRQGKGGAGGGGGKGQDPRDPRGPPPNPNTPPRGAR